MPSVRIIDRIEPVAKDWDALVDRLGGTPFQRPGWIEAWWRAFGSGPLHVLCAWRRSDLVGVFPVAGHDPHLRSPTNSESFQFGPVAEDEATTQAMLGTLLSQGARRISIDHVDGTRIQLGTWRRAAEGAGYRLVVRVSAHSPSVVVDGDWPRYETSLAKGFRSDVRRCRRRLAERGDLSVVACDGREGAEDALGELLRLEAAGWKGEHGGAIASRPSAERFYRNVTDWAAERGTLRLFSLRLDGSAVAVLYGLEEGGTCYAMKAGFDPAARRFSPGKLLLHSVIEHAFATGLARVELLGVDDPYKRQWSNAYRESLEIEVLGSSPRGLLEWLAFAHGRPLARYLGLGRLLRRSGRASGSRSSGR